MDEENSETNANEITTSAERAKASTSPLTPTELAEVVSSYRDRKKEIIEQVSDSEEVNREITDDIRYFFLWGYTVIEYYSAHLIRNYIIDDEFDKATWDYIIGNSSPSINQSHREELLMQAGVFDGIEGKIRNIKYLRNKFAHEPFPSINWEDDNVQAKMEKTVNIIDKLYSALDDEEVKESIRSGKGLE